MRSIVIALILISAIVYAQYVTDYFIIHVNDKVLANYLEEAYSYYIKRGLTPVSPCEGNRYPVYINDTMQFAGQITYRRTDEYIMSCVEKNRIPF